MPPVTSGVHRPIGVNFTTKLAGRRASWGAYTMRAAPLAVLCAIAAACAFVPVHSSDQSPLAIMDAYLIAHGMVESYGNQPDADPAIAAELARLDHQAAIAIRQMDRTGAADEPARAVAALSDYAASQTSIPR